MEAPQKLLAQIVRATKALDAWEIWQAAWPLAKPALLPFGGAIVAAWRAMMEGQSLSITIAVTLAVFTCLWLSVSNMRAQMRERPARARVANGTEAGDGPGEPVTPNYRYEVLAQAQIAAGQTTEIKRVLGMAPASSNEDQINPQALAKFADEAANFLRETHEVAFRWRLSFFTNYEALIRSTEQSVQKDAEEHLGNVNMPGKDHSMLVKDLVLRAKVDLIKSSLEREITRCKQTRMECALRLLHDK